MHLDNNDLFGIKIFLWAQMKRPILDYLLIVHTVYSTVRLIKVPSKLLESLLTKPYNVDCTYHVRCTSCGCARTMFSLSQLSNWHLLLFSLFSLNNLVEVVVVVFVDIAPKKGLFVRIHRCSLSFSTSDIGLWLCWLWSKVNPDLNTDWFWFFPNIWSRFILWFFWLCFFLWFFWLRFFL